ncbi:MAG TPA: threonine/serine dehydratase [Pararhizobium sp.]|uniref:threonine/serine dehydratase n=1 Tax=Pararhizobium sp. TaxID=1977563 RepID=UPI002BD4FA0B|nr:threonine/serine dehydratase [Pararhizobium sp.]HTO31520.1 threonine/serine dehydratase [Pararhizobium sp.]
MTSSTPFQAIEAAEKRIRPFVRETYLEASPYLSEAVGADVHVKLEHLQHTGSFKLRGAFNKILALGDAAKTTPVITASSGNHGAAVSYALNQIGGRGIVFVPENASEAKLATIRHYGAEVRFHGTDTVQTEEHARAFAEAENGVYVPPYNDIDVIGGQGTVAVEILRQLPNVGTVFASVGGGGLISGIASYLKAKAPNVKVIGCSPEASRVMAASVAADRVLDLESDDTLSDGTAGGLEPDTITFEICRDLVDAWVDVSEDEIAKAMRMFVEQHHMLVEGAAGVAIAAALKADRNLIDGPVVIVSCGRNVSTSVLKRVL